MKKGSALITTIMLLAVISTASFAIARLALIELKSGEIKAANQKAYYLAEGGIEEGLLRWRYDHQAELAIGTSTETASRESAKVWEQESFRDSAFDQALEVNNNLFMSNLISSKEYIGLTMYDKVERAVGNSMTADQLFRYFKTPIINLTSYLANRPDLYVGKDDKINFMVPGSGNNADDIQLVWRWDKIANPGSATANQSWLSAAGASKFGIEIRLFEIDQDGLASNLLDKAVFSPSGSHNIANSNKFGALQCNDEQACQISIKAAFHTFADTKPTLITISPLNANIVVGAFGMSSSGGSMEFADSISHIESIGVSGGRARGLETRINRQSGAILGLYDFVVFQGN